MSREYTGHTMTCWVLMLNKPENFYCGPYYSEEEAILAGHGDARPVPNNPKYISVRDGLLVKLDEVPALEHPGDPSRRVVDPWALNQIMCRNGCNRHFGR